jgi:hypothetical protein
LFDHRTGISIRHVREPDAPLLDVFTKERIGARQIDMIRDRDQRTDREIRRNGGERRGDEDGGNTHQLRNTEKKEEESQVKTK